MRTATELRALLVTHDLSGLQWTSRVIIDRHGMPRSHPVLVLTTRDQGDPLLAAYVHQQLRWWTGTHPGFEGAIADTGQAWASVPISHVRGAATQAQTRTHLIVCHLERRAMHHIIGDVRSRMLLRQQITTGPVYPWVYGQIHLHGRELDRICTTWDLWPHRLKPAQ
ncbi:MAG: hypothetical protein M3Y49_08540 [Actinomycetota bacterium]|nr:hypothetical protein [Actinomycetota bacterium]